MDCLVKTLKGAFSGEGNPFFKKLIIPFVVTNYDASTYLVFASTPSQTVTIKKNGAVFKTQEIETSNTRVYIDDAGASGDYELIFENKYYITRFDFGVTDYAAQFNMSDLTFSKIGPYLRCASQNITGDIKDIPEKCESITLSSTKFTGDIKNLGGNTNTCSLAGTNVFGDLVELAKKRAEMNNLSTITIRANSTITYNGRVVGVANYTITLSSQTSFVITTTRQGYPTVTGTYSGGQWVITES